MGGWVGGWMRRRTPPPHSHGYERGGEGGTDLGALRGHPRGGGKEEHGPHPPGGGVEGGEGEGGGEGDGGGWEGVGGGFGGAGVEEEGQEGRRGGLVGEDEAGGGRDGRDACVRLVEEKGAACLQACAEQQDEEEAWCGGHG